MDRPESRRSFVGRGAALGAALACARLGLDPTALVAAPDPEHPEAPNETVARILEDIIGDKPLGKGHIQLDMPVVAEDGRIVPVIIECDLPATPERHVTAVHLIVDHNPDAHLAAFHLTPAFGRVSLQTRIKMKRTTWVRALAVTSDGLVWADYAKVAVTLNGCG